MSAPHRHLTYDTLVEVEPRNAEERTFDRIRTCLLCGVSVNRTLRFSLPLYAALRRRKTAAGIRSPWSAAERGEE